MEDRFKTLTCSLVIQPPHYDRFYMDMRVYEVMEHMEPVLLEDEATLIWKGIYFAVENGNGSNGNGGKRSHPVSRE